MQLVMSIHDLSSVELGKDMYIQCNQGEAGCRELCTALSWASMKITFGVQQISIFLVGIRMSAVHGQEVYLSQCRHAMF